ncbi:hypothetical protein [Pseudomonas beijingensis]|jgi:hypothetical protein|uniref:Uncharacterized protein n=1 Tax=Pseudomonas beijingensis TaxID=2954101 RepID=A0ABY9F934_9PSED|nr:MULTISPECIES: hypothetical protein [unclassified Pseudomonas]WLG99333.1 hypothetical protein PSH92_18335 [Pseudomonas sp. FP2034]WLH44463.1 hypothetical protein PSH83_18995 [Pseudomonas sp. FP2262]WLI44417.1 hypothetical protein PSH84_23175 [Pseudomonas sp. FP830]
MHSFFAKTFGGLTTSYYIRQFLFGLVFTVMIISLAANGPGGIDAKPGLIVLAIINTLLYPYSRFVYESVVGYIMGNNVFFVNALFMLIVKVFTMAMCWSFAIFVAPVGLAYLFWRNSRSAVE